jgi:hypothetical protein
MQGGWNVNDGAAIIGVKRRRWDGSGDGISPERCRGVGGLKWEAGETEHRKERGPSTMPGPHHPRFLCNKARRGMRCVPSPVFALRWIQGRRQGRTPCGGSGGADWWRLLWAPGR